MTTPQGAPAQVEHVRTRTYLEQDEEGRWYCAAGFWYERHGPTGEPGEEPPRDPDDVLRVGPLPSRQVARFELRHGFRDAMLEAQRAFMAGTRARIVSAVFCEDP